MPYKDPAQRAKYLRGYWARPEMRHYQRDRWRQRRSEFFADKTCVDCGGTDRLELDHIDPAIKVAHDVWLWSEARREAEIAKCKVRCGECHKIRHGKGRWSHGIWGYNEHGCRCEVCSEAKAEANRRRRQRRQGSARDRTGVSSFAGKRVSHSATLPEQPSLLEPERAHD